MPAPSQLAIATSSLQRLAKEESSYHKELQMQQKSIERLEKDQTEETEEDRGNHEFQLKQERKAIEETKAVFPGLHDRIASATENLQNLLDSHVGEETEDVAKARKVLSEMKVTGR